jgi:hypothetical protein
MKDSDAVITMGCGDTWPIFPDKRYEDWDLADPGGSRNANRSVASNL